MAIEIASDEPGRSIRRLQTALVGFISASLLDGNRCWDHRNYFTNPRRAFG
jgi:hypothetical protein